MTQQEKEVILKGAEAAFFAAMLDSYAGDENRKSVKIELCGGCTTRVVFLDEEKHPGYIVGNEWDTHPDSNKSGGTTRILFCGKPIWRMTYAGHYPDISIKFLKCVLEKTYQKKLFMGGRGFATAIDNNFSVGQFNYTLVYNNSWDGNFSLFSGQEKVFSNSLDGFFPQFSGYHSYSGMSLL